MEDVPAVGDSNSAEHAYGIEAHRALSILIVGSRFLTSVIVDARILHQFCPAFLSFLILRVDQTSCDLGEVVVDLLMTQEVGVRCLRLFLLPSVTHATTNYHYHQDATDQPHHHPHYHSSQRHLVRVDKTQRNCSGWCVVSAVDGQGDRLAPGVDGCCGGEGGDEPGVVVAVSVVVGVEGTG